MPYHHSSEISNILWKFRGNRAQSVSSSSELSFYQQSYVSERILPPKPNNHQRWVRAFFSRHRVVSDFLRCASGVCRTCFAARMSLPFSKICEIKGFSRAWRPAIFEGIALSCFLFPSSLSTRKREKSVSTDFWYVPMLLAGWNYK